MPKSGGRRGLQPRNVGAVCNRATEAGTAAFLLPSVRACEAGIARRESAAARSEHVPRKRNQRPHEASTRSTKRARAARRESAAARNEHAQHEGSQRLHEASTRCAKGVSGCAKGISRCTKPASAAARYWRCPGSQPASQSRHASAAGSAAVGHGFPERAFSVSSMLAGFQGESQSMSNRHKDTKTQRICGCSAPSRFCVFVANVYDHRI